jgi:hypothetical protein
MKLKRRDARLDDMRDQSIIGIYEYRDLAHSGGRARHEARSLFRQ